MSLKYCFTEENNMLQTIVWVLMMAKTIKGYSDCGMYTANKTSCFLCRPGYYKNRDCDEDGKPAACMPCPVGTFQTLCNQAIACQQCDPYCKLFNTDIRQNCTTTSNLVCECKPGYFLIDQGGGNGICKKHALCPPGHGMSRPGTATADVQCEPCVGGNTYSNISSSTQQCQKCSTCKTPVISPCTPYQDTNCSTVTMTISDGWSQISPSVIIAVCVAVAAIAIILGTGLFIYFYKQRRRNQEQNNEAGQLREFEDGNGRDRELNPGPLTLNDDAVMLVCMFLAKHNVQDFEFFFRTLCYNSATIQAIEGPPADLWIEQSNVECNNTRNTESRYKLLKKWREWYGELDEYFFPIIKQTLEDSNANEILAQFKTKFAEYIPSE